jgi:RNA polymerase sigma-70 factor (ECF subfamily)
MRIDTFALFPMSRHDEFLPFFLAHQGDLRAFIGALIRDAQTREDIFQNVALTLWESFDRYDRDRSFGAWARGIAARKVLHEHRSNSRFPLVFPPEAIQSVLDAYDRTEVPEGPRRVALRECMDRLPARTKEILTLRYDQDLSGDSIAVRLGSTVDAVHQVLSRTRNSLADCIRRRLALHSVEKASD